MGCEETRGVAATVEGTSTVKHVVVNGESREAAAATLAALLEERLELSFPLSRVFETQQKAPRIFDS